MNTRMVAKNLVYLRRSHNWTQEEISEMLHISRQAISKWETGVSIPNLEALLELSKLYKITINDILEPKGCTQITDFEQISDIDSSHLKVILSSFRSEEIVKASLGASPETNNLLKKLFKEIDFNKEKISIGSVRITEIEKIHRNIVDTINMQLI
ncbi:MAG: helix-turn-helix domain-containing protein [Mobilitalea sp.]